MALTLCLKQKAQKGKTPLLVEVPVEPDLAPFLVTSAVSVLWLAVSNKGSVRAAVQSSTIQEQYAKILASIEAKGLSEGWGNIQDMTPEGLSRGLSHLSEYGFNEVDYLTHPGSSAPTLPGVSPADASWVPSGKAVLLPKNREYVGVTLSFEEGRNATIIHNAARGVVILSSMA